MSIQNKTITVPVEAMGKPRMTQRDKFAKRPCVLTYRAYSDELRLKVGRIPDNIVGVSWVAYFAMPKSWSQEEKDKHRGELHQSKPDRDNVDKGILDTFINQDSVVAFGSLTKLWDDGAGARIELTFHYRDALTKPGTAGRDYVLNMQPKGRGTLKPGK